MNADLHALIAGIHAAEVQAALAVTGAGSQAVSWLLGVGGASRTVLETVVPYSSASFSEYVGWEPGQYVSPQAAQALAAAAYGRAKQLAPQGKQLVGVGCTAAIASDRPKKGEHRAYVGVCDGASLRVYGLTLEKGARDRAGEEELVSQMIVDALAEAAGLQDGIALETRTDETLQLDVLDLRQTLDDLYAGRTDKLMYMGGGVLLPDQDYAGIILSGSFNPLHSGHVQLAQVAHRELSLPVAFELSIQNVDKPTLEQDDVLRRLAQFDAQGWRAALTRESLFKHKARLFPNSVFLLGYDTARRLVDPAYYDQSEVMMHDALDAIRDEGGRILVAGRLVEGQFHTLADIPIPAGYDDLFIGLSEAQFRMDISSTALRERQT